MFSPNMLGLNIWKIKKGKTVLKASIKIINESNHKPNKLLVDQEEEFYNSNIQK